MTSNGSVPTSDDWDVVIVGAGPAGMAAALYTGRAKLKTLLLDRAGMGGGQLMNTELIEDYPAIKTITGSDMATAFEEQIREFGVEVTWGEVTGFEARSNRRVVKTDDGTEYTAKAVIVSTGGLPRKLGVPGEAEFAGRAFACSPENLRLGRALEIFRKPDRIVAGVRDDAARAVLEKLFAPFGGTVVWMRPDGDHIQRNGKLVGHGAERWDSLGSDGFRWNW